MAANKTHCIHCLKVVLNNQNCIQCDECNKWIHQKCSNISAKKFKIYTDDHSQYFYCDYCQFYKCTKCRKHVYDNEKGVCCDICDNWLHQKCTNLTVKEYNSLTPETPWYCKGCLEEIFPFAKLDRLNIIKLMDTPPNINKRERQLQHIVLNKNYSKNCSICVRKLTNPKKGIPCDTCKTLIHRKCSGIPKLNTTLLDENILKNWECQNCNKQKFPFALIDNNELLSSSFNSNLNCICNNKENLINNKANMRFKYEIGDFSETENDPSFLPDTNDTLQLNLSFDYFQSHEFHKFINKINREKSFGLLHTNICSLQHNFDNLQNLIYQLDYNFNVIALSETWNPRDKDHTFKIYDLEGYQRYVGIPGTTIKSGCGFYVKNNIKFITRKDLNISVFDDKNEYQCIWIEIINTKEKNTLIGVYYRHPRKQSDDKFNDDLKNTLQKIQRENKTKIICGDFNYDLLKHDKCNKINTFINNMIEECIQPTILEPTRYVGNNKPSLIDNIFTNCIEKKITSGNITEKITDHLPNFLIIENIISTKKRKSIRIRDMKMFNEENFVSDLQNIPFIDILNSTNDIDTSFDTFHNYFMDILNKHAPYKNLSKKEIKLKQKPWLTKGILKSISTKNKYYYKYLKTKESFWYRRYKLHRDSLNSIIKQSKNKFYLNHFLNCGTKSKKIWSAINEILYKKTKNINDDIFLTDNSATIVDQKIVANKFNDYFINVAQNLASKLGEANTKYQDYLKNPNKSSFFLYETDPGEILGLIRQLELNKSSDIYGISPKIIKLASTIIANPLSIIFNKSFKQGKFPNKLKSTMVYPIHKSESKMTTSNYRPISILPLISKLLEKLMHKRLTTFIKKFSLLNKHQFGFQNNCSTEHAIIDLQSEVIAAIERKEKPCCIFLDFAKAFDTVNHDILLKKLEYYGVRGICLEWFKSYLTNRRQCVQIGSEQSDFLTIKCGVPQGSVLGPLLFLLYINDITASSKTLNFHLFADDTSIFYSHKNPKILQATMNTELTKVTNWLIANKLSLNVTKSNLILFQTSNRQSNEKITIKIGNEVLGEKHFAKYLGVLIDSNLTWTSQIKYVHQKLTKGLGLLAKLRHYVPKSLLLNLFNAFIQPHINYGLLAWGSACKTQLKPIADSLKKAVRIISFKNKREPSLPLLKSLKILSLNSNIHYQQSRFIWKCVNKLQPESIQELFDNTQFNHTGHKRLFRPFCRTVLAQSFVTHSGIRNWNETPNEIISKSSLKQFSSAYKDYILDNY